MRKLIFIKGLPGSGKNTFIDKMKWTPYALDRDQLRLLHRSPEMDNRGRMHISQVDAKKTHKEYISIIKEKMERGEFIVLDGIFVKKPQEIIQMAKRFCYDMAMLDFSSMDLSQVIKQNSGREEYKRVSESVIRKINEKYKLNNKEWDKSIDWFMWDNKDHYIHSIKRWLVVPMMDLSHYKSIVHVGDIQGCFSVLAGDTKSPFYKGLNKNTFYIFVGDLLDRGIENGKVLKWFIDHCLDKQNVILVHGNHEDHIKRWAFGEEQVSDEFKNNTLPQLLKEGITEKDAKKLIIQARGMYWYQYNEKKVLVTHAGLSSVPVLPELISLRQFSKGTGYYNDPIDEQFERNAPLGWFQVHGHRNNQGYDICATKHSFNLEDQVEFGGNLRVLSLNKDGWIPLYYKNKVYNKNINKENKISWDSDGVKVSDKTMKLLQEHPEIKEKVMIKNSHNHVVSFNFTKKAFFQSSWDDTVVKARGFFVNKNTHEVVARGYDKFFNINEREETQLDKLCKSLQFPITGYVKENGFLGNIGYDSYNDELFVATKSSSSGDFSEWFQAIIDNLMNKTQQQRLSRWLRDNDACMTFEVIDPVNDPHMIDYDKSQLILLDVFHRSEHTERLSYQELEKIAHKFNFQVKEKGIVLHNATQFSAWFKKTSSDLEYRFKGKDIEGFVFEDINGNMTKIKMANYAFWKKMRSQKERIRKEWEKVLLNGEKHDLKVIKNRKRNSHWENVPLFNVESAKNNFSTKWINNGKLIHPMAGYFIAWFLKQPVNSWTNSIIKLRNNFVKTLTEEQKKDYKEPFILFNMNDIKNKKAEEQKKPPKFK